MKKQSKVLSLALGMALLGATAASIPAMASETALFSMHEVSASQQIAADAPATAPAADTKATPAKCGTKHCGAKKCTSKAKKCASKKAADSKCGAGSCGSKKKITRSHFKERNLSIDGCTILSAPVNFLGLDCCNLFDCENRGRTACRNKFVKGAPSRRENRSDDIQRGDGEPI